MEMVLKTLEERIEQVVAALSAGREREADLERKVADLEGKLAEAEGRLTEAEKARAEDEAVAEQVEALEKQKADLGARLEKVVALIDEALEPVSGT